MLVKNLPGEVDQCKYGRYELHFFAQEEYHGESCSADLMLLSYKAVLLLELFDRFANKLCDPHYRKLQGFFFVFFLHKHAMENDLLKPNDLCTNKGI